MSVDDVTSSSPEQALETLKVVPATKIEGHVLEVLKTQVPGDFRTYACEELDLELEGIGADRHSGFTRLSGGREPYYPRGTQMCNERQLSLLAPDELALVARRMDIDRLEAGWIGGNIVIDGIANLTLLPPRTRLVFSGGSVIRIDGDNAPCRAAGKAIGAQFPGREGLDLEFPKKARRLRGLVGYVEKPGILKAGETVTAFVPEQWIYAG